MTEQNNENAVADVEMSAEELPKTEVKEEIKESEEVKDLIPQFYAQHGGDPRLLDISFCVMLNHLPTDYLADTFEQFTECMKNMLQEELKLKPETIKQMVRIPKLESNPPNQSNALRVLLCFTEKQHKHRMVGRKTEVEANGMSLESLSELPADVLEISDEDARALADLEMAEEEMGDELDVDDVEEEEEESHADEHDESDIKKEEGAEEKDGEEGKKGEEKKDEKPEPKKKVYEDEDEKAPFEMNWDGAPEFQWRLTDGPRDEKKLIIDNLMWADLNNVFIYRTIQKATAVDINFPMRFTPEGNKTNHGKITLYFPGFVAIMDEALKHLIYFRSGDGRRIKVFLPQTNGSLKRKEEFEGKLGRLIKPTPRMMELIIKVLPKDYTPTLDEACAWFPYQSVIGCELINDEMGQPCAVVKFETAEEAVAAHSGKSFVTITQKIEVEVKEGEENEKKEKEVTTNCNVFMRGVEAHFGSLLTFFDQRRKAQEQRANRRKTGPPPVKRPAGSTIRGPAQKRRVPSPQPKRPYPYPKDTTPRGGARGGMARSMGRGGSSQPRRSSPPRSMRGGRQPTNGMSRSAPRSNYRDNNSYSGSSRGGQAFSGYGYAQFDRDYSHDRPSVDPFGRPVFNSSAFGNSSSSSFHRDDSRSNYSSSFQDRRRY